MNQFFKKNYRVRISTLNNLNHMTLHPITDSDGVLDYKVVLEYYWSTEFEQGRSEREAQEARSLPNRMLLRTAKN